MTYLDTIALRAYRWVPRNKVRRGERSKGLRDDVAVITTSCLIPRLAATDGVVSHGSAWRGLRRGLRQISQVIIGHAVPVVGPESLAVAFERGIPLVKQLFGDVGIGLEHNIAGVPLGSQSVNRQWRHYG